MKYSHIHFNGSFLDKDHFIYQVFCDGSALHLFIKSRPHPCACPVCGTRSEKFHATCRRTIQAFPVAGYQTLLHFNLYSYECLNPSYKRRSFREPLPMTKPYQAKTESLDRMILEVSMFLSAQNTSLILKHLGVLVSPDTVLRMYRHIRIPDSPDVEKA